MRMIYFKSTTEPANDNERRVMWLAAWWLIQRGRNEFTHHDSPAFVTWCLRRNITVDKALNSVNFVQWCNDNLFGLKSTDTNQPNPYLLN